MYGQKWTLNYQYYRIFTACKWSYRKLIFLHLFVILLIGGLPPTREHFKTNKIAPCQCNNEVNEAEINTDNLEQVQKLIKEDPDLVFDALVAADYIDQVDCPSDTSRMATWLKEKYNPYDYIKTITEVADIYNVDECSPTTGTVFPIFAINNSELKINNLFDTEAMKSVMSYDMY